MTNYLILVIATCVYATKVVLIYSTAFKGSKIFYVIGLMESIIINSFWLYLTKNVKDANSIFIYGAVFNMLGMLVDYGIPTLIFKVKTHGLGTAGLVLMIVGTLLLKIS